MDRAWTLALRAYARGKSGLSSMHFSQSFSADPKSMTLMYACACQKAKHTPEDCTRGPGGKAGIHSKASVPQIRISAPLHQQRCGIYLGTIRVYEVGCRVALDAVGVRLRCTY